MNAAKLIIALLIPVAVLLVILAPYTRSPRVLHVMAGCLAIMSIAITLGTALYASTA